MMNAEFDICVSGTGIVGKALALALSIDGWQVAWATAAADHVKPSNTKADVRTYVLNAQSIALLERLRVWDTIATHATPLQEMQIAGDATGRLAFTAWQQCVSNLGYIADAHLIEHTLSEALTYAPHVVKVDKVFAHVPLHAICQGKYTSLYPQLGAVFEKHDYAHWGVAARLTHDTPHQGIARQWFFGPDTSPDVLALLPFDHPLPGASYGLVWSTPQSNAKRLIAMDACAFEAALHERLGKVGDQNWEGLHLSTDVAAWPLSRAFAQPWVGPGWALLGDAAHSVHPLAGQGLNLGLADVSVLVQVLHEARDHQSWRSIGDLRTLKRYERARWFDTQAMLSLTDSLVHLFASSHPLVYSVRNNAMSLINQLSPIKRYLVKQALGQSIFSY